MGLFDSIRRVVGGDGTAASDDGATQPDRLDTRDLDVAALRERAAGVADEVDGLDFSRSSLAQFDDAIDGGYDENLATADRPGVYATDTVRFGCYLGEVLVRTYDGEWTRDPDWGVTIAGPDGTTIVAVFDVAERSIRTGAVFAAVADRAGAEVGLDGAPADSTPTGTADGSDTESLIEEAEPAPADGDAPDTTDASSSLFGDESAGAGPTVADAPSADDGPQAPAPGPEDTGADDGVDASATATGTDSDDAPSEGADTATPEPTAGGGLRETYAETAEELVSFWTEYDLDYTPDSLERLDALVSDEWDDDRFDDADFGSEDSFDDRVFTSVSTELGSYFGEVLVRELDAEWSDRTATDGVVVEGAEGPLAIPVFKVAATSITQQPVFARSYDSLLSDIESDA